MYMAKAYLAEILDVAGSIREVMAEVFVLPSSDDQWKYDYQRVNATD